VLIWLWLPALSLGIFLFISAWHFSGDWSKSLNTPLRLCAGALLLLMPIGFHTEAVYGIFEQLSGQTGGALAVSLALPTWLLTTAMIILVGGALWKKQWQSALEFTSLFLLAYFTLPLLYFTLYFCLLHSPRHLSELFIAAPTLEHSRMLRMMLIYTLATLVLLGGLGWYWATLPTSTLILRLIFIGLAAVTVPHMLLIGAAFLKNRTKLSSF
jgi:Brp/Blh family beta-carotene 15,15'-monooxygenase